MEQGKRSGSMAALAVAVLAAAAGSAVLSVVVQHWLFGKANALATVVTAALAAHSLAQLWRRARAVPEP